MVQTGFFIFVVSSVLGWIWEVIITFLFYGKLVNRGMLYGPWLPIYGIGAVAIFLVAKYSYSPLHVFLISAAGCGVLEYATSVVMEHIWSARWWNYGGKFNINGRIDLLVLIVFGAVGLIFYYLVVPNWWWVKLNLEYPLRFITLIIMAAIVLDFIYSQVHPNVTSISSRHPF